MARTPVGQPHLFEPPPADHLTLRDRFLVPPFSVLEARAGYWQERKQAWLNLGIKGELGARELDLLLEEETGNGVVMDSSQGRGDRLLSGAAPRAGYGGDYDLSKGQNAWGGKGTSVFDPVLCELIYRWFSPPGGLVVDPFAGGSVRGIVAAALERRYHGTDLSARQIDANYAQAAGIGPNVGWPHDPVWVVSDARELGAHVNPESADLIFSCPPYYDLEVYSDEAADLSAAPTYAEFLEGYRECIAAAVEVLRQDRFACFVVGEVRDKRTGHYVGLVPDTIRAFEDAGAAFYNEGILVTSVGSLPIRTSRLFGPGRKLGKSHQNVLVFIKGSWKEACAACGLPDEVAIEYGGATWHSDGVVEVEETGEELDLYDTSVPAF